MSLPMFDLLVSHKNTSVVDSFRMNTYVVGLDFPKNDLVGHWRNQEFCSRGGGFNKFS